MKITKIEIARRVDTPDLNNKYGMPDNHFIKLYTIGREAEWLKFGDDVAKYKKTHPGWIGYDSEKGYGWRLWYQRMKDYDLGRWLKITFYGRPHYMDEPIIKSGLIEV